MKRASQTCAMHGAEAAGTRSGDNGVATTHATLATLTSLGPELDKMRRLRLNTQRGGKEDCSHPRKEVWEGEVEHVELEEVVEAVALVVAHGYETPTGCAVATLHHEDERFPSDYHGTHQSTDEREQRRLVVSEEGKLESVTDHLQPHVSLEHEDHPEEALVRHGLTEPREVEEEKGTSNSRTVEGGTELHLQLRETTVCDSQRGTRHHNGGEDACPELWANDPPEATLPMPKHLQS